MRVGHSCESSMAQITSPAMHDMLRMKGIVSVKERMALIAKLRSDNKVMPVMERSVRDTCTEEEEELSERNSPVNNN